MALIKLPNGWDPRPYQRPLWDALERGTTRAFAICHRRWGKDDVALHRAAVAAHERVGNYWHLLPEQEHARRAIWDAVNPHSGKRRIDEAFPPAIRKRTVNQSMMIEFRNGSIWQVLGSDNYNQYIGASPIGVVFSEFALADPAAWAFIRPILLENKGWALFITTSRGRNHAVTFYEAALKDPAWFACRQAATETNVFTAAELAAERRGMIAEFGETEGRARYEQEYLCSFDAPMSGSVWGAELMAAEEDGRICAVPHDPALGVDTWWDLGVRNATVIWFTQDAGREVHVIDHARIVGGGLPGAVAELRKRPYSYVAHHAPHDIRVTELGTGRSRLETALALGIRFEIVPNIGLEDGISAARQFLGLCWFDREKTAEGRAALAAYHRAYDPARKVYSAQPVHDWASDDADGFRYLAVGHRFTERRLRRVQDARALPGGWMSV